MKTLRNLKASVIIPTYNRANILNFTLNSIANQTLEKTDFEVIVIDDGSSDNTESVVKSYEHRLDIKYIFQEDIGNRTGEARNKGIMASKHEICIFIDAGMILGKNCLEEHIKVHHLEPSAAIIGYAFGFEEYNQLDSELINQVDVLHPDTTIDKLRNSKDFLDLREECYKKYNDSIEILPAPWVFFWTCNVSIKRMDLFKVGLFDINYDLTWGFEDLDIAYRLHRNNIKIMLHRQAEAIHYPHPKEDNSFKQYCQIRNARYFHQKYNSMETSLYLSSSCLEFNDYLISNDAFKVNVFSTTKDSNAMMVA